MKRALAMWFLVSSWMLHAAPPKPAPPKGEYAPPAKEQDLSKPAEPAPEKPKAFTLTADEITKSGFVSVGKDGARVTHTITKDTLVLQAGKPAKFADIKPGATVTGLRTRTTDTDYVIIRVTRFIPKPPPKASEARGEVTMPRQLAGLRPNQCIQTSSALCRRAGRSRRGVHSGAGCQRRASRAWS